MYFRNVNNVCSQSVRGLLFKGVGNVLSLASIHVQTPTFDKNGFSTVLDPYLTGGRGLMKVDYGYVHIL